MSQTATNKRYRATFILDTRNHADSVDALIDGIKENITGLGASVETVENLGTKEFVRVTDRNFPSGVFVRIDFESAPSVPGQFQERFRLDKTVNRILIQERD